MKHYVSFAIIATAMCLLGSLSFGAVAVALLLLLPSAFLKKGWGMAATIAIGLVCLADIFCQEYFFTSINVGIVRLVKETNPGETGDFFKAFLHPSILGRWRISACLALILSTPFAARIRPPKWTLAILMVPGIIGLWSMGNTPPGRFVGAVIGYNRQAKELEKTHQAAFTAVADSCSFRSVRIVLVIGESFNKHHASAYGYRLPTTPFQDARKADGSLVLFQDAVTPWNMTGMVFEKMFSVPFPAILKRAGYTVNFYSNQNPSGRPVTNIIHGKILFSDQTLSDVSFSHRNTRTRHFDHDFLQSELPAADSLTPAPVLDIIHLKGQHFDYHSHYPKSFARFTEDNATVMHYDNATYYNDYVLECILRYYSGTDAIVIFVADHGEEVYDELPMSGRYHGPISPAVARAEYEVPMWVWCSEEYVKAHPDVVSALPAASARPFYTSDISHLVLALAGASGPFTSASRNVLSSFYVCPPRIMADMVDYDRLVLKINHLDPDTPPRRLPLPPSGP